LEILQFPAGKGDPKWQIDQSARRESERRLFLGIDHTAIVVGSTEKSLRFYRDLLGLQVKGESENYGPEQERLNNVFGARLHITSLRAGAGPGIEFLEYLAAQTGRPYPADEQANDLIHWQTHLRTNQAEADAVKLAGAGVPFVSSGTVTFAQQELHFSKGFM